MEKSMDITKQLELKVMDFLESVGVHTARTSLYPAVEDFVSNIQDLASVEEHELEDWSWELNTIGDNVETIVGIVQELLKKSTGIREDDLKRHLYEILDAADNIGTEVECML